MAKAPFLGVPSGEVRTETPDGSLQSGPGGAVYSNGPYEQENYCAYGMPGMGGGGYHLRGPITDPMAPYSREPTIQMTGLKDK